MQRKWSQLKTQLNSSKKKASKTKIKIKKDQLAVGLLAQWLEPCTGNAVVCVRTRIRLIFGGIFFFFLRNSISWKNCFNSFVCLFVLNNLFFAFISEEFGRQTVWRRKHMQVACWRKLVKHCKQISLWDIWNKSYFEPLDKNMNGNMILAVEWTT